MAAVMPVELAFVGGRVRLGTAPGRLGPGLSVESLEVEVEGVELPIDVSEGAAQFQHHPTRLVSLVLDVDLPALLADVAPELALAALPDRLVIHDDEPSPLLAELAVVAVGAELRVLVVHPEVLGGGRAGPVVARRWLEQARGRLAPRLGERVGLGGAGLSLSVAPLDELLLLGLPRRGFKLPRAEHARVESVSRRGGAQLRIVFGAAEAEPPPEPRAVVERALAAAVDEGRLAGLPAVEPASFRRLRAELDPAGEPAPLARALLQLGSSEPALFVEALDLAIDLEARLGGPAHLARARIDEAEGRAEAASAGYERAATHGAERGDPQRAALLLAAAARLAGPERALALLELATSWWPGLPRLERRRLELAEGLGRAEVALDAARALGARGGPADRARADAAAGRIHLARGEVVAAKRAFERALLAAPSDLAALEGLARAVSSAGDPRRAHALFEEALALAEAGGDGPAIARIAVALGDLVRARSSDAARHRYARAAEADPRDVGALLRLVRLDPRGAWWIRAEARLASPPADERLAALAVAVGEAHLEAGRASEAARAFERAIDLGADAPEVLERLLELYEAAPADEARRAAVLERLGDARRGAGRIGEALEAYAEAATLLARARLPLTVVREKVEAIAVEPSQAARGLEVLGELADLEGDDRRRLELLERRLVSAPDRSARAAIHGSVAAVLERLGRRGEALKALERALELDPSAPSVLEPIEGLGLSPDDAERVLASIDRASLRAHDPSRLARARACLLLAAGELPRAIEAFDRLEARGDVPLPQAVHARGLVGDPEGALRRAERALSSLPAGPDRFHLLVDRVFAAEALGEAEDVEDALLELLILAGRPDVAETVDRPRLGLPAGRRRLPAILDRVARSRVGRTHAAGWLALARLSERAADLVPALEAAFAVAPPDAQGELLAELVDALAEREPRRALELAGSTFRAGHRAPALLDRLERLARAQGETSLLLALADARDPTGLAGLELALSGERLEDGLGRLADRVQAAPPGPELLPLVRRAFRRARAEGDGRAMAFLLGVWSQAQPELAGELLLKKATAEAELVGDPEAAIDTLRTARPLAPPEVRAEIEDALARHLAAAGRHAERVQVLLERKEPTRARRVERVLEAVRAIADELGDPERALATLQAAEAAERQLPGGEELEAELEPLIAERLGLLRRLPDRRRALAAAIVERARRRTGAHRADLLLEAAQCLAPDDGPADVAAEDLADALDLALAALDHAPDLRPVDLRILSYARRLGRHADALAALGRSFERAPATALGWAAGLARAELLAGDLAEPLAAQAGLEELWAAAHELPATELPELDDALRRLGASTRGGRSPSERVLELGLELTRRNEDWSGHVRFLERSLSEVEDPKTRADLHLRIGEVLEWRLGEGQAAERQYRAALAASPGHVEATAALSSLYLSADRFRELAESFGVDALRREWRDLEAGPAGPRQIAAAEALWPLLDRGSEERADVLLRLADLYRSVKNEAAGAVLALEEVVKSAPASRVDAALERLAVLFREEERWDLYADVLRKRADRVFDDAAHARALADVGEILEWKVGDGPGAEREYRAALAVDAGCESAHRRLRDLLAGQDRFAELAVDLGPLALEEELEDMLARGRDPERVFRAAEALEAVRPAELRRPLWLDVARRLPDPNDKRRALAKLSIGERGDAGGPEPTEELAPGAAEPLPFPPRPVPPPPDAPPSDAPALDAPPLDAPAPGPTGSFPAVDPPTALTPAVPEAAVPDAPAVRPRPSELPADLEAARAHAEHNLLEPRAAADLAQAIERTLGRTAAVGPRVVADFLAWRMPATDSIVPPIALTPPVLARLLPPSLESPLGQVLRLSAEAVAAVLPPVPVATLHARLGPADDPRLDALSRWLEAEVPTVRFRLELQEDGPALVWSEPGDPPILVVGAGLLAAPTGEPELRFHLVRELVQIALGDLLLTGTADPGPWVELLVSVAQPHAASDLPEELLPALGPLRARLGPALALALADLGARVPAEGRAEALERVSSGIRRAADRAALLAVGTPHEVLEFISRRERVAHLEPARRLAQSVVLRDLVSYLYTPTYLELLETYAGAERLP